MDVVGWLWWTVSSAVGLVWSLLWFLIGGWVSAIAQIIVVALIIFGIKFGWRQAPFEMWARAKTFGRFVWGWIRSKDGARASTAVEVREVVRTVRIKEAGDVNVSTLLSALTLVGLIFVGTL